MDPVTKTKLPTLILPSAVLLLALGACAGPPTPAYPSGEPAVAAVSSVTIRASDEPARDLFALLAGQSGQKIRVSPDVRGELTVSLENVPWDLAAEGMVKAIGAHAAWQGQELVISDQPVEGRSFAAAPVECDSSEKLIDIDVDGQPLGELLSRISAEVGEPIAVDDFMAKETVSVSLRGIPWREGVDVVTRMTCSGETRDTPRGLRVQGFSCYAHLYYTDAPVRTMLCLLAELEGYNLILAPSVQGEVTISSSRRGFLYLLEALARATDTRAEIRDGLILVGAEPGWGSTDIDGEPVPEPWTSDSDRQPRNRIRARGLPLRSWISLLAWYDHNRPVIVSGPLAGTVEADLTDADLMEALQTAARRFGLRVREEGGLLAIKQEGSTAPQDGQAVRFKAGNRVHRLQGLYSMQIDEDRTIHRAVIDGTVYSQGEPLTYAEGKETPFALAEVTTSRIVVVGRGETTQAVDFDH